MSALFDRICIVQVEDREWSDLRVSFRVARTSKSKPNKSEISIYNLSESSRALLKKLARVRLVAGYAGNASMIFAGQIDFVQSRREGADLVSTITAADGRTAWNSFATKSYAGGVRYADVVRDLATAMGIAAPLTSLAAVTGTSRGGVALYGYAHRELDLLMADLGLEWSIQDGVLQVVNPASATTAKAVVLSPSSGLLGAPELSEPKHGRRTLRARSLLQPTLTPGRRVVVESKLHSGDFRVDRVDHSGDSHGGEFVSDCYLSAVQ